MSKPIHRRDDVDPDEGERIKERIKKAARTHDVDIESE